MHDIVEALITATQAGLPDIRAKAWIKHVWIPNQPVLADTVLVLLGNFSAMSLTLRRFVMAWIIITSSRFSPEATQALHARYAVLFHFLDYERTRPLLCRLLFMLTRRVDVTAFRCKELSRLVKKLRENGQSPVDVVVLAGLYEKYAPHLMFKGVNKKNFSSTQVQLQGDGPKTWVDPEDLAMETHASRFTFFTPTFPVWLARVENITCEGVTSSSSSTNEAGDFKVGLQPRHEQDKDELRAVRRAFGGNKNALIRQRGKLQTAIPSSNTNMDLAQQKRFKKSSESTVGVTLAEVKEPRDLVYGLVQHGVLLPDRCSSLLGDVIFQHLLRLEPNQDVVLRLRFCLPFLLESEMFSSKSRAEVALEDEIKASSTQSSSMMQAYQEYTSLLQDKRRRSLMTALVHFTRFQGSLLPEIEAFVYRFLVTWDGVVFQQEVLELVSFVSLGVSTRQLEVNLFSPLYKLFASSSIAFKFGLLRSYTKLRHRWALLSPSSLDLCQVLHDHVVEVGLIALLETKDDVLVMLGLQAFLASGLDLVHRGVLDQVPEVNPGLLLRFFLSSSSPGLVGLCKLVQQVEDMGKEVGSMRELVDMARGMWTYSKNSLVFPSSGEVEALERVVEDATNGDLFDTGALNGHSTALVLLFHRFQENSQGGSFKDYVVAQANGLEHLQAIM